MSAAALSLGDKHEMAGIHDMIRKATGEASLEFLAAGHSFGERYSFKIKPGYNTACWRYAPPHQIYIGDEIPSKARPNLATKDLLEYFKRYAFHEMSHLLWTDRDLQTVERDLKKLKVPFSLWNSFEDARIENRYRAGAARFFDWTRYETVTVTEQPEVLFFALVQYEGALADVEKALLESLKEQGPSAVERAQALLKTVTGFYLRCLTAASSKSLYPILTDWCKEFPPKDTTFYPSRGNESPGAEGQPDLTIMLEGLQEAESASAFDAGSIPVSDPEGKPSKDARERIGEVPDGGNADLLSSHAADIDEARVAKVALRLGKLFEATTRRITSEVPSRRISVRHLALARPFYRHQEVRSRARKQVLVVVDCSGSMGGNPIAEGRILVAALSQLARQGAVTGHVVLSGVKGKRALWQRFALPLSMDTIERIYAFGSAEGLESSIRNNLKLAQKADYVFVYTDADICDKPIAKDRLHLQGVYTWGLYVGGDDALEKLKEYFDKSLIREDAERLVEAMLLKS